MISVPCVFPGAFSTDTIPLRDDICSVRVFRVFHRCPRAFLEHRYQGVYSPLERVLGEALRTFILSTGIKFPPFKGIFVIPSPKPRALPLAILISPQAKGVALGYINIAPLGLVC